MMGSNRSLATRPLVLYPTAPGAMHAWQSDLLGYGKRSMKMRAFTNDPCLDQSTGPPLEPRAVLPFLSQKYKSSSHAGEGARA